MKKHFTRFLMFLAVFLTAGAAIAQKPAVNGPFSFEPLGISGITGSRPACSPIVLPEGFTQTVIAESEGAGVCGGIMQNIYPAASDLTDMSVVNETGKHVGRYLYRTHEVGSNGAVSVIDLETMQAKILTQHPSYRRLDGLKWTPWGTLLFAEETTGGHLWEVILDPQDPSTALAVHDRAALGRMAHEGITVDALGNVYVGDELTGGAIFKFVPAVYGDLSSGTLYALKVIDESAAPGAGSGTATWVALIPGQNGVTTSPAVDARAAAAQAGATGYARPEDNEIIGDKLYVAVTGTDNVYAIQLYGEPFITEFVPTANVGTNTTAFGLQNPDNLTADNAGNLYIVEDNVPSDIWVATPDLNGDGRADSVKLFGTVTTAGAEGTGIYFSKTRPREMFINVQHPSGNNDLTILISKD